MAGESVYLAIDSQRKNLDGITWFLACVWRVGDRVTPSRVGGFPDVQREVLNFRGTTSLRQGGNNTRRVCEGTSSDYLSAGFQ